MIAGDRRRLFAALLTRRLFFCWKGTAEMQGGSAVEVEYGGRPVARTVVQDRRTWSDA